MSKVAVLAHWQENDSRASTFMAETDADELVRRMFAERISRRRIRLFAPDSIFTALRPLCPPSYSFIPENLPPLEVEGTRFVLPPGQRRDTSVPRWFAAMFAKHPAFQEAQ